MLEASSENVLYPQKMTEGAYEKYEKHLEAIVTNDYDISIYGYEPFVFKGSDNLPEAREITSTYAGTVEYLIVVPDNLAPVDLKEKFYPLVDWLRRKGLYAFIITEAMPYNDPSILRGWLQNFYTNNGLTYVLLGGDWYYGPHLPIVPIKYHQVGSYNIPTDLYYSDLTGDWDFGTPDYHSEIYVGRLPFGYDYGYMGYWGVSTDSTVNFINKLLQYEKTPTIAGEEYLTRALWTQEDQWQWQWEKWYKITGAEDEANYLPEYFQLSTILQEDIEFGTPNEPRSDDVISEISKGYGFINTLNHGAVSYGFSTRTGEGDVIDAITSLNQKIPYPDSPIQCLNHGIDLLSNKDRYSIWYSESCNNARVDGNDCYTNCLAEAVLGYSTGAVAFLGYTRVSYIYSAIDLHKRFMEALFFEGEYNVGATQSFSKELLGPPLSHNCFAHNLFGCPETPIWTRTPKELIVCHPPYAPVGTSEFTVKVTEEDGVTPVQDAYVCLWKKDEGLYKREYANVIVDEYAVATFDINPTTEGEMYVTVTKHNYIPYEGTAGIGKILATSDASTAYNNQRKLVYDDNTNILHFTFESNNQIFYTSKTENANWEPTDLVGVGECPTIGLNKTTGIIGIAWRSLPHRSAILYNWKDGNGWHEPMSLYGTPGAIGAPTYSSPSLAVDNTGKVHITVETTFAPAPYLSVEWRVKYGAFPIANPSVGMDWEADIDYALCTFDDPIDPDEIIITSPSIDVDNNTDDAHIAWHRPDIRGTCPPEGRLDIYYISVANGIPGTLERVFESPEVSHHACISVYDNYVNIVWQEGGNTFPEGERIYLARRPTDATIWDNPFMVDFNNDQASSYPVIIAGSQILWQELDEVSPGSFQDRIYWSQFNWTIPTPKKISKTISLVGEFFPQAAIGLLPKSQGNLYYVYTYGNVTTGPFEIKYEKEENVVIPLMKSGHMSENTIITEGTKLVVTGDLTVDTGVTLTIEPGVTTYFGPSDDRNSGNDSTVPELEVYGTLIADSVQFIINSDSGKQYWRVETFGADASAIFTDCSIGHEGDLLFCSNTGTKSPQISKERLVYTDNTDKIELPMVFKFSQNEPNPFFKSTVIKYQLPTKSKVSLRVYDITGRCVKTLINSEKEIGYYTVKWDSKEFSAGIYFMKFFARDGTEKVYKETKKLILLR